MKIYLTLGLIALLIHSSFAYDTTLTGIDSAGYQKIIQKIDSKLTSYELIQGDLKYQIDSLYDFGQIQGYYLNGEIVKIKASSKSNDQYEFYFENEFFIYVRWKHKNGTSEFIIKGSKLLFSIREGKIIKRGTFEKSKLVDRLRKQCQDYKNQLNRIRGNK